MVMAAEIVGVSESLLHAFLSEKFPPNGKRGDSCVYVLLFSLWQECEIITSKSCFVQHKDATVHQEKQNPANAFDVP